MCVYISPNVFPLPILPTPPISIDTHIYIYIYIYIYIIHLPFILRQQSGRQRVDDFF